jgi:FkbM family methyltransferase
MAARTFALPGESALEQGWPAADSHSSRTALHQAWRVLAWQLRWGVTSRPWRLRLGNGSTMLSSCSARGFAVYRAGYSEPETARFLWEFLKPGMTFWDVGAHTGEYSLLAAGRVSGSGCIRALEPHPLLFDLLSQNLRAATCRVHLARKAVTEGDASVEMVISRAGSRVRATKAEASHEWLPAVSLDQLAERSASVPNLIRVSVSGAERLVLEGATRLLDLPAGDAPVWIMPYQPDASERYGYDARYLLTEFGCCGYGMFWLTAEGLAPASHRHLPPGAECNFVAVKREAGGRG